MALHRGIQSAIFYYLSCAPCSEIQYRKRRKQEAQRDRADRAALEAHMPGLYRHPSPSSTNRYWQAEIDAGPTYTRTKRKANTPESQRGLKQSVTLSSAGSNMPSSDDLNPYDARAEKFDSKGNLRLHQREDEELWGGRGASFSNEHLPMRPPTARTTDTSESQRYHHVKNPAINDLHPPTTRKVTSPDEVMWMLQPPPVAEVMSGKKRVGRGRSESASSKPSVGSSMPLSRQVSTRLPDQKNIPGGRSTTDMSRQPSMHTTSDFNTQQHDAGSIISAGPESARTSADDQRRPRREKRRPSPIKINGTAAQRSTASLDQVSPTDIDPFNSTKTTSRPKLLTILSDSVLPPSGSRGPHLDFSSLANTKENSDSTSSTSKNRAALQDLHVSSSRHLAPNPVFAPPSPASMVEARSPRPALAYDKYDSRAAVRDGMATPLALEAFDSWYKPDFELPKWIHEQTKREVRQRWSFDI